MLTVIGDAFEKVVLGHKPNSSNLNRTETRGGIELEVDHPAGIVSFDLWVAADAVPSSGSAPTMAMSPGGFSDTPDVAWGQLVADHVSLARGGRIMPVHVEALRSVGAGPLVTLAAPDFDLPCTLGAGQPRGRARLADYRGRWLILLFYPRDFSLVCPTEVSALSARLDELHRRQCDVLGISVDTIETHEQWIDLPPDQGGLGGLRFPLASDEDAAVARAYRVYSEQRGVALRGLFIIDPKGMLQYQVVHNQMVGRHTDEVLRVLDALRSDGLCAESWKVSDAPIDPTTVLGPGRVVSHFRIQERVGEGTFAVVYRAWDMQLDRPVALKILKRPRGGTLDGILAEARAAASLSHPHICTLYSVDNSDGVPFIAMEFVPGNPLSRIIKGGPMAPDRVRRLAWQVASALSSAHAQGLVHGDLKPANVVVSEGDYAKVLDFGLATYQKRRPPGTLPVEADPAATQVYSDDGRGIVGTPAYMSPEQARGAPLTPASDVFSFGCVLYEMLTGQQALRGRDVPEVLALLDSFELRRPIIDVPSPFWSILESTLVLHPHQRIEMAEVARALG